MLQPQSACIICLHHAAPRHADAEGLAPCEKRWRNKVAKERAKAGLGNIWDLALRSDSSMFEAAKHRRAAPSHKATGAGAVAASNRHRMNHDSLGLVFL